MHPARQNIRIDHVHDHLHDHDLDRFSDDGEEMAEEDVLEVIDIEDDATNGINGDDDRASDEDMADGVPHPDTSLLRFAEHSEPVFCLAAHPHAPDICASGGADDLGYIWHASSGATLLRLDGHRDSLAALEFSHDGQFLATGAVDGSVKIWQATDPQTFTQWHFLLDLEASEEVTWLSWHPKGLVLLAGCSDGMVLMWQIPSGTIMHVFAGHDSMTTCGTFTPDGKTVVTGSESGVLIVWSPRDGSALHKLNLNEGKHQFAREVAPSGINSLAVNQTSTLCAVGGIANGGVRLVSLATGTVVGALDEHARIATVEVGLYESATGVALLVSAGTDGLACIHDAVTFKLRNTLRHEDAITTLVIDKHAGTLSTGSLDKSLATWDIRSAQLILRHNGHDDVVHMAKLTCDSKKLISCSDDGTALVFGMTNPQPAS